MTHDMDRLLPVLVGVDGSESSLLALDWAAEQARLEGRGLALVHAATLGSINAAHVDAGSVSALLHDHGRRVLHEALERARDRHVRQVRSDLVLDDPAVAVLDASRHASAVVVGSRGLGPIGSRVYGSVGATLVRRARCPVVVHRPDAPPGPGAGVLGGTDGTARCDAALDWAARVADLRGLPLTVLCALGEHGAQEPLPGADRGHGEPPAHLDEVMARLTGDRPQLELSLRVVRERPDQAILRAGAGMGLVVLGSHHPQERGLVERDVTTRVLEHAAGVVAVVP